SSKIKRRVRNRIIESICKAHTGVVDLAEIPSKLNRMISVDPREIVRDVVHGRYPGDSVLLASWLEHKPETNVIPAAIPALSERLPRKPVAEVVHPMASNRPVVPNGQTARVA